MSARIGVVGGAGHMGSRAVRSLVSMGYEVVSADRVPTVGLGASSVTTDVLDPSSLRGSLAGLDLIMNFAGPFYGLGDRVARAAIDLRTPYIDICDDAAATEQVLELDEAARLAGVPLVVGAGSSPGVLNALALLVARSFDKVDDVVLTWVVGERGRCGPAPLNHFFYGITEEIPIWSDGARTMVGAFTPESEEEFEFPDPVGRYQVRDVGHPEAVTLPRVLEVRSVRNKGALMPRQSTAIFELLKHIGMTSDTITEVAGARVVARDFLSQFLTDRHNERSGDAAQDVLALGARVRGVNDGVSSERGLATAGYMTMANSTSLPAVAAVPVVLRGLAPGVHGPEVLSAGEWFPGITSLDSTLFSHVELWKDGGARRRTSLDELATVESTAELAG